MTENESNIIRNMADRLEHGESVRYQYELLFSHTQQEVLARVPNLLILTDRAEQLSAAIELLNLCSVEA